MTLAQWANLADIVAAIAVVASIVYLARQVRMTRQVDQTATFQSIANSFTDHIHRFFSAPNELALRGLNEREGLSEADRLLFDHLLANLLNHAEMAEHASQSDLLAQSELAPLDWWLTKKLFCYPGAREWLSDFAGFYPPSFVARMQRASEAALKAADRSDCRTPQPTNDAEE